MGLKTRIQDDIKAAMRGYEKPRLATLRMITAAIKQREIDDGTELDDTAVLQLLDKMVKQRRESVDSYTQAGRDELAASEQAEIEILQEYLPQPLTDAEIETLVEEALSETGASTMKDMGRVMSRLKPQVQGRAEMSQVSQRVKSRLSG